MSSMLKILFLSCITGTSALSCGGRLTEDCLGDTDVRYDPDASNFLVDQALVWKKLAGFFRYEVYSYKSDYTPEFVDNNKFLSFPSVRFENKTVSGTRFFRHYVGFRARAIDENVTSPDEVQQLNVGQVEYNDIVGFSSYEKDGSATSLSIQVGQEGATSPIGNTSLVQTTFLDFGGSTVLSTEMATCLDSECNRISSSSEVFLGGEKIRQLSAFGVRITEEEFITEINEAYGTFLIPLSKQKKVPLEAPYCFRGEALCPTDEDFCSRGDPSCSESPYQEPDGKIKPGVIAGFAIAAFVLLLASGAAVHLAVVDRQAKNYRTKFAKRVAETIPVKKSMKSLTPEVLAKEFKMIDDEHGGRITKDKLWDFMNTGKVGDITTSEFEALWAVMDHDDHGYVDFLEFCAFLGRCHDEYTAARPTDRASVFLAASTRLSTRLNTIDLKALQEEDEEMEKQEAAAGKP